MSTYSKDSDVRLIRAARILIPNVGCSGLNLRSVARKAHVNLGMFHYHFRTKAVFKRRVLESIYEKFFNDLSRDTTAVHDNMEKLQQSLVTFGRFSRDHRRLISSLAKDILGGDQVVIGFMSKNFPRHLEILLKLIEDCQKEGRIVPLDPSRVFVFLMSSINAPHIIAGCIDRLKKPARPHTKSKGRIFTKDLISDEAIVQRVKMALKGLTP